MTPLRRLQAKGEMSNLKTGKLKDLSIHPDQESFILSCPDLMTKCFQGIYNIIYFQDFSCTHGRMCVCGRYAHDSSDQSIREENPL